MSNTPNIEKVNLVELKGLRKTEIPKIREMVKIVTM